MEKKIQLSKSEFDGLQQRRGILAQKQFEVQICQEAVQQFFQEVLKAHKQKLGENGQWLLEGDALVFKQSPVTKEKKASNGTSS